MSRKMIVCLCVPVGECQRDDVRPQIEEYVPAVSATTNTIPSLQRSAQHAVPIYNMRPWWRRQRCSVVLRPITRKPTRLPCSCFPHAPLGYLGLRVLFLKQFGAAHMGGILSTLSSSSLQQHLKGRKQCDDSRKGRYRRSFLTYYTHLPIYAKVACCQGALNQIGGKMISVAEMRVTALFQSMVTRVFPNPAAPKN